MVKRMKIKGLFLETGWKKGARPMKMELGDESVCMRRIKRPQPTLSHKSHPACTKGPWPLWLTHKQSFHEQRQWPLTPACVSGHKAGPRLNGGPYSSSSFSHNALTQWPGPQQLPLAVSCTNSHSFRSFWWSQHTVQNQAEVSLTDEL